MGYPGMGPCTAGSQSPLPQEERLVRCGGGLLTLQRRLVWQVGASWCLWGPELLPEAITTHLPSHLHTCSPEPRVYSSPFGSKASPALHSYLHYSIYYITLCSFLNLSLFMPQYYELLKTQTGVFMTMFNKNVYNIPNSVLCFLQMLTHLILISLIR